MSEISIMRLEDIPETGIPEGTIVVIGASTMADEIIIRGGMGFRSDYMLTLDSIPEFDWKHLWELDPPVIDLIEGREFRRMPWQPKPKQIVGWRAFAKDKYPPKTMQALKEAATAAVLGMDNA